MRHIFLSLLFTLAASLPAFAADAELTLQGDQIFLVDLPGYGFAKAPEKIVKQWQKLIFAYLQGRPNLKRVFLRSCMTDLTRRLMKT